MNNYLEVMGYVKEKILKEVEYGAEISDTQLQEIIANYVLEQKIQGNITFLQSKEMGKELFFSLRKLDILQDLIDDSDITEIMINGVEDIFVEKEGKLLQLKQHFESSEKLNDVIQQIVATCNRTVNELSPIVDARLADGARVNAVLNPIALNGPILTIRRFPKKPMTISKLQEIGSLTVDSSEFLEKAVKAGYNIIVSGGTGSGKTTFLNALSGFIPSDERIITIEDSAELQIQNIKNLVRMETRNSNVEGCIPITIRDLIKTSLRMRPDRIIVGEVRGGEAMDMICSAMNCGHDGSMSTIHANNAREALSRLETMILMAVELPITAIRRQIVGGVDLIIHLGRLRDKTRKVLEISEIVGYENGEIIMSPIYKFIEEKQESNMVMGRLQKIEELKHVEKLERAGIFK
ncbi:MAG: CpaF family protein [Eubacteriales bacterium]